MREEHQGKQGCALRRLRETQSLLLERVDGREAADRSGHHEADHRAEEHAQPQVFRDLRRKTFEARQAAFGSGGNMASDSKASLQCELGNTTPFLTRAPVTSASAAPKAAPKSANVETPSAEDAASETTGVDIATDAAGSAIGATNEPASPGGTTRTAGTTASAPEARARRRRCVCRWQSKQSANTPPVSAQQT